MCWTIRRAAGAVGLLALLAGCEPRATSPAPSLAPASGAEIYRKNCAGCHQPDGGGQPGVCPPLHGSPRLQGDPTGFLRIVLCGMKGTIEREGASYTGIMPSWRAVLGDEEIALLANSLDASVGADLSPVTPEMVEKVRAETAAQSGFLDPARDFSAP